MLCRMIAIILLTLTLYGIWFTVSYLLGLGAVAWMQAQAQAANTTLQIWVSQQPLGALNPADLNQFILETTRTWVQPGQSVIEWFSGWLPVGLQMVTAGLLGLAAGSAIGWYLFVHREGWMKALWILTAVYLVSEFLPVLVAWWLLLDFQNGLGLQINLVNLLLNLWQVILQASPGLMIGFFLALGKSVYDESRDRYLDHECPQCHRLLVRPGCECGRQRGFERVSG
jgi:hypothetical protein